MENTLHYQSHKGMKAQAIAIIMAFLCLGIIASAQSSLVQKEIARRSAAVEEAHKLILKGRAAYTKGKYEQAVSEYRKAVSLLPSGPIAAERRRSYVGHLVDGTIALSAQYRRKGRYDEAKELLQNVLAKDPGNVRAIKELEYFDDPIRTSPTLTYKHVQNIEKVKKLLYRGESYYNQGQYDEALKEYTEVLRIDRFNKAARRGMEKVHTVKADYYRASQDEARARMLTEIDSAWEFTVPAALPTRIDDSIAGITTDNPSLFIRRKLQTIVLENVNFRPDTTVRQAINFLRLRARELDIEEQDPADRGINFVFRDRGVRGKGVEDLEDDDEGAAEFDDASKIENITLGELNLRNVPIEEALKQICQKTRLRYKVENYAVVILRIDDDDNTQMFTRTFRVPPDFKRLIRDEGGSEGSGAADPFDDGGEGATAEETVQELLVKSGIPFPSGASAIFSRARAVLTIRNTPNNLDIVEALVEGFKVLKPKQVKMTTKFVEIQQENTDELGFDWIISPFGLTGNSLFLGGGNVGNGSPRFSGNFGQAPSGANISGIPSAANQNVSNILTSGLRSGDFAITRNSIDSFLNNPNRTAQNNSVAPGILSLTGLFSDGQVQMIMRGLSQKKGADVMNAPSIVSRSGERATIEIVREFIYPAAYDPPELPNQVGIVGDNGGGNNAGGGVFPVTPATATAFETRNTGVTFGVEPTLGDDGYTIELDLEPEIVEFEGFINYGSPIQTPATDALGNAIVVTITDNRIEMPVFSTRTVKTALTIYDGHTVAVGGLIRESVQKVEDKVPVLGDLPLVGRLFQSNSENRIKSNLIIFVTANIIDATGQRVLDSSVIASDGGLQDEEGLIIPPGNN